MCAKIHIVLCVALTLGVAPTALAASPYGSEFDKCVATHDDGSSGGPFTGYDIAVGRCMKYINQPRVAQSRHSEQSRRSAPYKAT
jgi:hypothetical protein